MHMKLIHKLCLAVLRRDGFVPLDAGDHPGLIVTKPFQLAGQILHVNVDAPQGELRADVLNVEGNVLAVSAPLKGDVRRGNLQWQQGKIAALQGQRVSLRFTLRNGRSYSYWFQ